MTHEIYSIFCFILLSSARITPVFLFLPFFSKGVLSGSVRVASIIAVGMGFWPYYNIDVISISMFNLFVLIVKEAAIGLFMGFIFVLPFWIFHAFGSILDNQRGATLSSTLDPINGIDTSELSNFFSLLSGCIYLSNNGMLLLWQTFKNSYNIYSPDFQTLNDFYVIFDFLQLLCINSLKLSAPFILILFLIEATLGVLSRFSPQMNAFQLALTLKSISVFFMLLAVFYYVFPLKVIEMFNMVISWAGVK